MQELLANQELLWVITVVYDLGLAILLYRFFGKYGLYTAVVLGIILGNLQGGKISELELFGYSFTLPHDHINFNIEINLDGNSHLTDVLGGRSFPRSGEGTYCL